MAATDRAANARHIVQNAYVVNNIHLAMDRWHRAFGIGPFFLLENAALQARHRGRPVSLQLSVAMAQAGPVNIELIQQLNSSPSPYRDIYPEGEEGFHHQCSLVADFEAEVSRYTQQGYELSLEAEMEDYRFAYVDTQRELGCHVELVESAPAIRELYARVAGAAQDWDGRAPVRPMYTVT